MRTRQINRCHRHSSLYEISDSHGRIRSSDIRCEVEVDEKKKGYFTLIVSLAKAQESFKRRQKINVM